MNAPSQSLGAWLKFARTPYLNLLRNLTPQVFLASMAWLFADKLAFNKIDISNWLPTAGFYVFIFMFFFACYANISLFFEEAFDDLNRWMDEFDKTYKEAIADGEKKRPKLLKAIWCERKLELMVAVIVLFSLEYIFAGVIASSIAAAVSFPGLIHR